MHQTIKEPLISICVPCYNHEKFIPYFMETLLRQHFQNWELIITDDCSTDRSWDLLQSYAKKDGRIRLYQNDKNRHLCQTINNSFHQAKGKYILIMYTDDAFMDGQLENNFNYLECHKNISVLYNDMIAIGEENEILNETWKLPEDFSKYSLLHTLFLFGNCMFIPGLFFRKSCLDEIGPHNPFLCLTQDYEFHIRLMLKYDIAKSDTPQVYYRRRSDEQNLSANTLANTHFICNEMGVMLRRCVELIPDLQTLHKIFPELPAKDLIHEKDKIFYAAKIMITSLNPAVRNVGLNLLYDFCFSNVDYLEKTYNFLPKDFMHIAKGIRIYNIASVDKSKINNMFEKILYKIWHKLDKILKRKGILRY